MRQSPYFDDCAVGACVPLRGAGVASKVGVACSASSGVVVNGLVRDVSDYSCGARKAIVKTETYLAAYGVDAYATVVEICCDKGSEQRSEGDDGESAIHVDRCSEFGKTCVQYDGVFELWRNKQRMWC